MGTAQILGFLFILNCATNTSQKPEVVVEVQQSQTTEQTNAH